MKFKGKIATYGYDDELVEDFLKGNENNEYLEVSFAKAEVTFRDGQIRLFDKDGNWLLLIVPILYPDEPYRVYYPDDDEDAEGFDKDGIGRLLVRFEITED